MPPNDPNAYRVPGNPASGVAQATPGPGPGSVQRTGAPVLAGAGDLTQEVIQGYMSLTPAEKQTLLRAMEGVLGEILKKVLPNELDELLTEAIQTDPSRIGPGTTPPMTGRAPAPVSPAATPTSASTAPAPAAPGSLGSAQIPPRVNNALAGFR